MALASAVLAALSRAEEIGARSVAIPAISTGVFDFPVERAAEISVAMATSFGRTAVSLERIVFCLYDERSFEIFRKEAERAG
jgi:O-acetyl-ADP-ribose deacetylase (regulator of RNase III)